MSSSETRECPYCKETIKDDAVKCKHCGSGVAPKKPSHGGICPYCKEEINTEAIRCKHCKSILVNSSEVDCTCNAQSKSVLSQAPVSHMSTTPTSELLQMAYSKPASPVDWSSLGHVIIQGPKGDCLGRWVTITICPPLGDCYTFRYWKCQMV